MSVRLSTYLSVRSFANNNSAPTQQIFVKFSFKSDRNNRYFTWKPIYIFDHISLILRMRNVLVEICGGNQNAHFMFNDFFSKISIPFFRKFQWFFRKFQWLFFENFNDFFRKFQWLFSKISMTFFENFNDFFSKISMTFFENFNYFFRKFQWLFSKISMTFFENFNDFFRKFQWLFSKKNFYVHYNFFFFENHSIYEILWKNIQPSRARVAIWLMPIACWITKVTDTHWEYVKLIVLLLLQWLHERA